MRTRNDFLSEKEQDRKIQELAKEKRLAAYRAMYWKKRFEEEYIVVDKTDNDDCVEILSAIDSTKVSPEMKLLLEQQGMAVRKTSNHGYRWHPKLEYHINFIYIIGK